jgi:hypothetical protein
MREFGCNLLIEYPARLTNWVGGESLWIIDLQHLGLMFQQRIVPLSSKVGLHEG